MIKTKFYGKIITLKQNIIMFLVERTKKRRAFKKQLSVLNFIKPFF